MLVIIEANAAQWKEFAIPGDRKRIYEPSGVRQLPDGRIMLVQDEAIDPLDLIRFDDAGTPVSITRPSLRQTPHYFWKSAEPLSSLGLEDLEGLAHNSDTEMFYAISSHSRTEQGKRHKHRERLVRFKVQDGHITDFKVYKKLLKSIRQNFPIIDGSTRNAYPKGQKGFNIEGLCFDRSREKLLIGLRGPILDGKSLILTLDNPSAIFENEKPHFSPSPVMLDLSKGGIRAMTYVPSLDIYLLVTQKAKKDRTSKRKFRLWTWKGEGNEPARELRIKGIDLRMTEGIAPVHLGQQDYLILVSDDGNRVRRQPANYLLLPLDQIAEAPGN